MKRTKPSSVRVELVFVYASNEGDETFELQFVDDSGKSGPQLEVWNDGSMHVVADDELVTP